MPDPATNSRPPSRTAQPVAVPTGRVTRLRAAQNSTTTTVATPRKPSNFLAKGKEGFRKVSDKLKEKEKEKEVEKQHKTTIRSISGDGDSIQYSESLKVRLTGLIIALEPIADPA
jgi:kinesin family protein 20